MKTNTRRLVRFAVMLYVAFSMVFPVAALVVVSVYFYVSATNRGDTFLQVLTVAVSLIIIPILGSFVGCGIARLFKKKDSKSCQKTQ